MALDDSDDVEGRMARALFRTDSDSTEDSVDDDETEMEEEHGGFSLKDVDDGTVSSMASLTTVKVVRTVMHVEVEEVSVGGSIEHRLWPAAEYLASFVGRRFRPDGDQQTVKKSSDSEASRGHIDPRRASALQALEALTHRRVNLLELGAGVGLTGLELASQWKEGASFIGDILLTDLNSALPLLQQNTNRNREKFRSYDSVTVQRLEWGNAEDAERALEWCRQRSSTSDMSSSNVTREPLLILGSDCVYWECLHNPLEQTMATLLQRAPHGSVCLLASVRRWKRDNRFFQTSLGRVTAMLHHRLRCVCVNERVERSFGVDGTSFRQVMRVYAIQWLPH